MSESRDEVGVQTGRAVGGNRPPSVRAGTPIEAIQMNQSALGGAELGAVMTEEEMGEILGGSKIGYWIGYGVGFLAGIIVNAATNPDMQPYCFGA
jgi:hypothetical protein